MGITVDGIVKLSADQILANVLNTAYFVGGAIAVLVIIVAGYIYVTSANESKNIEQAKNAITYSVIGLVVVLLAFVITNFVIGIF